MIDLILLAAGNSRRFRSREGDNKLLCSWRGQPMYWTSLERWKNAADGRLDGGKIYVVSREQEILETAEHFSMVPVFSPESSGGISWSIRNGLKAAQKHSLAVSGKLADHYVFGVTDQPMLTEGTIRRFLEQAQKSIYACAAWEGTLGNPVSFPRSAVEELMRLEGDCGGKKVLRRHLDECTLVSAARKEELKDIDTLEQLLEAEQADSVRNGR